MHPGMWMPQPTYATLVTLLIGYDTVAGAGFLGGFDEFIKLTRPSGGCAVSPKRSPDPDTVRTGDLGDA